MSYSVKSWHKTKKNSTYLPTDKWSLNFMNLNNQTDQAGLGSGIPPPNRPSSESVFGLIFSFGVSSFFEF